jgi:hypothetical protein
MTFGGALGSALAEGTSSSLSQTGSVNRLTSSSGSSSTQSSRVMIGRELASCTSLATGVCGGAAKADNTGAPSRIRSHNHNMMVAGIRHALPHRQPDVDTESYHEMLRCIRGRLRARIDVSIVCSESQLEVIQSTA